MNCCLPDAFKAAHITPLLKKPDLDADALQNYLLVSKLSILSKTLEHAVVQQMESYLQSAGILPSLQSAYRKGHSTETALVNLRLSDQTHGPFSGSTTGLVGCVRHH